MNWVEQLMRSHLKDLVPYSSARDEYSGNKGIFLDANENAFGSVIGKGWNRYPDPYQKHLKSRISKIKEVREDRIFLGNGSDEPIDLLIRAFCEPGRDKVLVTSPTYGMYRVSASIHNIEVIDVNLKDDFQLDEKSIIEKSREAKIIFLCSPNNPTGNLMNRETILRVVSRSKSLVVVDEAYIDFSTNHSLISEIENHENLIILQTFSKAWGLAALRAGLAFGDPFLIELLNKIKPPYNISGPVQKLLDEALDQVDKKDKWVENILIERERLSNELSQLPVVVKVHKSNANFLLVRFTNSSAIFAYLKDQKVIIRDRSNVALCEGCLRITVGTPKENSVLMEALKNYE